MTRDPDPDTPTSASPDEPGPGQKQPGSLGHETTIDQEILEKRAEVDPVPVLVELNLRYGGGLEEAKERFQRLFNDQFRDQLKPPELEVIAQTYFRCMLRVKQIQGLVDQDQFDQPGDRRIERAWTDRAIYRVWLDHEVQPLLDRSAGTVKADAARRSYAAAGGGITWAVIDSGIDATHPHFSTYGTLDTKLAPDGSIERGGDLFKYHKDFTKSAPTKPEQNAASALTDPYGHGTHVAGIIAGALPENWNKRNEPLTVKIGAHRATTDIEKTTEIEPIHERTLPDHATLSGIAPRCKLISLRVLDEKGKGRASDVMNALFHVRVNLNGEGKLPLVHGVNISLGYDFNAKAYACGHSPLCVEVDRVVRSGVVVVVAAGNTGYGSVPARYGTRDTGLSLTINDPGNAARAITVGSTHRDQPHTYGVSYFSSKGPTADGRLKPDIVAPGERITSCAAGKNRDALLKALEIKDIEPGVFFYLDDTGTSFAAPHVSGVIAAFLSIRDEFTGQPEEVKRIFLENATSLGRERYFEGHGLVDLMRAIQAV